MSLRDFKGIVSQSLNRMRTSAGATSSSSSSSYAPVSGGDVEMNMATVIELEDLSTNDGPSSSSSSSSLSSSAAFSSGGPSSSSTSPPNVQTFRTFARMLTKADIERAMNETDTGEKPIILVDEDGVPISPNTSAKAFKMSTSTSTTSRKSALSSVSSVSSKTSPKKSGSKGQSKKKSSLIRSSLSYPPENPQFHTIQTIIVHSLQIIINIIFAGFSIAGKFAMFEVNPLLVLTLRYNIAVPFMLLAVFIVDGPIRLTLKQFVKLSLLGFLGVFLSQVFFFLGLDFTSATSATILQLVVPPITATVSILMKREKGSFFKAAGLAASVLGAMVIIGVDGLSFSIPSLLGDGFVLISSVFASFYFLFQQTLIEEMPAFTVSVVAFSSAALFSLCSTIWQIDGWRSLPHISLLAEVSILYIALAGTVFAYLLLPWCQQRSSLLSTSCYITIQPMIAALLSWLFLGEDLSWTLLVGGIFIIIGLGLVAFSRYREERALHFDVSNPPPIVVTSPDSSPTASFTSSKSSPFSKSADKIVEVNMSNLEPVPQKPKMPASSSLEMVTDAPS
eukprot:TRINITY_DN1027_c2_g1_i1.p1 TRINITY_DN1027_c2_g1~~TRINITY_DN1027_c2_g1_i1.p1  ORF type:complete len:592 (+),score=244.94 TRINITY_DN1027_c2_g1_i1:88-1776(+)